MLGMPYNAAMDANKIIDALGGTNAVAAMCEIKPASVSQWRTDGIPQARELYLRLLRPEVFEAQAANDDGKQVSQ
jgi:hypothetical protein